MASAQDDLSNKQDRTEEEDKALETLAFLNTDAIDTYMCSKYCPCPAIDNSADWTDLSAELVSSKNRKGDIGSDTMYPWIFGQKYYRVGDGSSQTNILDPGTLAYVN